MVSNFKWTQVDIDKQALTERRKTIAKVLLLALLMVAVVMPPLTWFLYQNYLNQPLKLDSESMVFRIPARSNLVLVASEMGELNYLKYPRLLVWHAQLTDSTLIQAGEYRLEQGITPKSLLEKFNSGEVITFSSTVPEGWSFSEMRQLLESNPNLLADTAELSEQQLIEYLGLNIESLEGWFYPDTYVYARNTRVSTILIQAHQRMSALLAQTWAGRDAGLPFESAYEALILASIVEKETGAAYERPEIAGVFVRRLQKGMKLQTDPTVIYAMGDAYSGNIRRSDLSIDSPYNTYRYRGLPPTPIAAVGEAALQAAMHPAAGEALYFVAKGDGSHYFSSTLEEHNQAVRDFQINRRAADYRSAPAPTAPPETKSVN